MSRHRRPVNQWPTRVVMAGLATVGLSLPTAAWAPPPPVVTSCTQPCPVFNEDTALDPEQVVNGQACNHQTIWLESEQEFVEFCAEGPWWR
jgi:hypothetical protein